MNNTRPSGLKTEFKGNSILKPTYICLARYQRAIRLIVLTDFLCIQYEEGYYEKGFIHIPTHFKYDKGDQIRPSSSSATLSFAWLSQNLSSIRCMAA